MSKARLSLQKADKSCNTLLQDNSLSTDTAACLINRGRSPDGVPIQGVIGPEPLCWYTCQPFFAVLQRLKVYILCDETGVCKNEVPATVHSTDVGAVAGPGPRTACKHTLFVTAGPLRSCICHSSKLIACHEAANEIACITLRSRRIMLCVFAAYS